MGFVFKDGLEKMLVGKVEMDKAKNEYLADKDIPLPKLSEPKEIHMSEEMTNRLWEVINENTELKQQLYMVENKLEQIKRLL